MCILSCEANSLLDIYEPVSVHVIMCCFFSYSPSMIYVACSRRCVTKHYSYLCYLEYLSGTHLDAFPNQLSPMEENLYLVDGGFSINSPFPLVLQPERDVDVILSFNFSWEAPFEVREHSTVTGR